MSNKKILPLLMGFALGVGASFIYAMSLTGVASLTEINARLGVIKAEHVEKIAALKQREEDAKNARIAVEQEQHRIEAEEAENARVTAEQEQRRIEAEEKMKWEGKWEKLSNQEKQSWLNHALNRNYYAIADCSRDGGYPYIDDSGTNVRISGTWGYEFGRQFKYSIVYANGMSDVKTMYDTTFQWNAGSLYRGSILSVPINVKCARG